METEIMGLQKHIEDTENKMLEILLPECRRLFGKRTGNSQEKHATEQEIKAFLELRKKLPKRVRALTGYEIAVCGGSGGMSGFSYGYDRKSCLPFQMIGWSSFVNYLRDSLEPWEGIAFRIERACFDKRSPVLFFEADSSIVYPGNNDNNESKFIQRVCENSSGIADLKVVTNEHGISSSCRLEFRLTDAPQDCLIHLQSGLVRAGRFGGYVIQIPICGEFDCTFGEVTVSGDIILHRDSFCMK